MPSVHAVVACVEEWSQIEQGGKLQKLISMLCLFVYTLKARHARTGDGMM